MRSVTRTFLLGKKFTSRPRGTAADRTVYTGHRAYLALWQTAAHPDDLFALAQILRANLAKFPVRGQLTVTGRQLLSSWSEQAGGLLALCGIAGLEHIGYGIWYPTGAPAHDPLLEESLTDAAIATWGSNLYTVPAPCTPGDDTEPATCLRQIGINLDAAELRNLRHHLARLGRVCSQAELALLSQTDCEHTRHHFFRTVWANLDDPAPLLDSLRATVTSNSALVAYTDNAAVLSATMPADFIRTPASHRWHTPDTAGTLHTVFKAETHNHPTALAPFSGAATGVGGEIRDEAATGRGATSRAGLAGYIVSALHLPELLQQYGQSDAQPPHLASALQILIEAPLGTAAYGNEFGRPLLGGFCRSYEHGAAPTRLGFHKPVMFAAGCGAIDARHIVKHRPRPGDLIVQLGGPGMRVGIGGGSASSASLDTHPAHISVQRDNADMQRRVQEVIDSCRRSRRNVLRSLHDVGAGGIGNAVAELVAPCGCELDLDNAPVAQADLLSAEILCNEAQERYVATIAPGALGQLRRLCAVENCPLAVLGKVVAHEHFVATIAGSACVNLPIAELLRSAPSEPPDVQIFEPAGYVVTQATELDFTSACRRVLADPAVADKSFLVTIADRNVGGLSCRDQPVGPWQITVADCAVILDGYRTEQGRALALGERPAVAAQNPAAGARIAIAEALTNLAAARIGALDKVALALNWLGNRSTPADRGALIVAVRAACAFARALDIGVVTGKDSLTMRTAWTDKRGTVHCSNAPACCIATATAPTSQACATCTPQLSGRTDTYLMLLDAAPRLRLGGSVYAAYDSASCGDIPDVDADALRNWWGAVQELHAAGLLLAYHDISDGGLIASVCEMAFAGNCGATLVIDALCQPAAGLDTDGDEMSTNAIAPGNLARMAALLFCEAPGAVIEVAASTATAVLDIAARYRLPNPPQTIGRLNHIRRVQLLRNAQILLNEPLDNLYDSWSGLTRAITARRDHIDQTTHRPWQRYATAHVPAVRRRRGARPPATVLRDQGSNGHIEMAAALDGAGFAVKIVALAELAAGLPLHTALLVLPGGFTYGDTLGAGIGQGEVILRNRRLRKIFSAHFAGSGLTLGVCNGCQVLSRLGAILPTPCAMPRFALNRSQRFEARLVQVEVIASPSPFLAPLANVRLPVPLACSAGRVTWPEAARSQPRVLPALRYLGADGLPAQSYPYDPCGANEALCGFTNSDGKVTMLMPHPERAVRPAQLSWCPPSWRQQTAWHDFFVNACNYLR